jgi:hypothetical protein
MDVQSFHPLRFPSVRPATRDCVASECGVRKGMLLRDALRTDYGIRLIYVCEHCGAGVNVALGSLEA